MQKKKIPGLDSFERGEVGVERPVNRGGGLKKGSTKNFSKRAFKRLLSCKTDNQLSKARFSLFLVLSGNGIKL